MPSPAKPSDPGEPEDKPPEQDDDAPGPDGHRLRSSLAGHWETVANGRSYCLLKTDRERIEGP